VRPPDTQYTLPYSFDGPTERKYTVRVLLVVLTVIAAGYTALLAISFTRVPGVEVRPTGRHSVWLNLRPAGVGYETPKPMLFK